jgi:hypothetical protein
VDINPLVQTARRKGVVVFFTTVCISEHHKAMGSSVDAYRAFENFAISFPDESVAHVEIDRPRKYNSFSDG